MSTNQKIRVLMVCAGNICRSPMAEAVFQHLVEEAGLADRFEVASAGTGSWHVGERPHPGTQAVLKTHGVGLNSNKRAQQLRRRDFEVYDYVVAMDAENVADILRLNEVQVPRLLEFAPSGGPLDVVDPYYHDNFESVYQRVVEGCQGLLSHIREHEGV